MISEMVARTGLLACAGGNVCNQYEGIPRNMTAIGSKLKAAGYSTHQFGKVTTQRPPAADPQPILFRGSLMPRVRGPVQWDAGAASPDHTPLGRGFDTSLGYFDHCND